jgi:circadian clock protein KaiC
MAVDQLEVLQKSLTGIQGLDEVTYGGLPQGRPTLVVGAAGSGKTLLGMAFLVAGATQYNEPGVFVTFEETPPELAKNFASLGVDLDQLQADKRIAVDHVYIERSEIEETGEYDLEGLFVRLGYAIDSIGAKRIVLDTLEALFSGLSNTGILRAELRRLFRWLKDKGVTAVITAERGEATLTRHGMEEYVADCVIMLDTRMREQVATRRLRIIKYRGSAHGTNEYPFIIDSSGISVLPITSLGLTHEASKDRVPTGIERLDAMMAGKGYYRGSSILVSGQAGTGKSSVSASFVDAACGRGERVLYFAFEESPSQIMRNMRSIGIDLERWVEKGLLTFHASRPTLSGLETHLAAMGQQILKEMPAAVVVDPVTNLTSVGSEIEVQSMLTRLLDILKSKHITSLFTTLVSGDNESIDVSEVGISSLMDTWISLRNIEINGERNRGLYILKSRGMKHSNQIREFILTDNGVKLTDVYVGPGGVLTGTARVSQEAMEKADAVIRRQDIERKQRQLDRKRELMEAQVATLRAGYQSDVEEIERIVTDDQLREKVLAEGQSAAARLRGADEVQRQGDGKGGSD